MGFFSSPGLDAVKSATTDAGNLAKSYTGIQNTARNAGNRSAGQLFNLPADGGLNPYLKEQFGREKEQIGKAYGDTLAAAQKGVTARGMGVAPSGASTSMINTAGRNAGEAETGAYGDAVNHQLGLGLEGVKYNQEQQQMYNPLPALGTQMQGGQALQAMGDGSGFSKVMKGVGTVAPLLAAA
jgi:hypothetical protein